MRKKNTTCITEADVRSACVDVIDVADEFYKKSEIKALGNHDDAVVEHVASMLSSLTGTALIDACEQLMNDVRSSKIRHDTGTVYTPQDVVEIMLGEAAPSEFDTIVDTGCGCARFTYHAKLRADKARVVGVELDPLACLLAATVSKLTGAGFEVVRGDFLKKTIKTDGRALYIGNPPYVRHHMLTDTQKAQGHAMAKKLKLDGWSGLAGLYAMFIMRVLTTARKGDRMLVVTGAEWINVGYGKALRDAFASKVGGGSKLIYYPASMDLFNGAMSTALISQWEIGQATEKVRCAVDGGERFLVDTSELENLTKWGAMFSGENKAPNGMDTVSIGELFRVSRGIVTGNNDYFVRPRDDEQAKLMRKRAVPVVARATDIPGAGVVEPRMLKKKLLLLDKTRDAEYIAEGERRAINEGFVASHRKPWYGISPKPAPILATYMRRGRPRFALNPDGCPNLNTVHGLYPKVEISEDAMKNIVEYLNTGELYGDTGRVYQGGLVKYEPREMERIEIPREVVGEVGGLDG